MDRELHVKFHRDYAKAMIIYGDATHDYVAGRCCKINGIFFRGDSLMCEAIEKALKAIYYVQNRKEHPESRHNLINIKRDLNDCDFLNQYNDLLQFLTDA